jgi:hypothetical protein
LVIDKRPFRRDIKTRFTERRPWGGLLPEKEFTDRLTVGHFIRPARLVVDLDARIETKRQKLIAARPPGVTRSETG